MSLLYRDCNALLFPSRLETWGLPISEARQLEKILIVSDLPYAHETVGGYKNAVFIDPLDHLAWASVIERLVNERLFFEVNNVIEPRQPFASGWRALWKLLTKDL
jgi:glycosyltransferase involved in cell wall biosynthesis